MIVTINGQKAYIDIQKVNGMLFEPKTDQYNTDKIIVFFEASQMSMFLPCKSQEEAFKIIDIIEESKRVIVNIATEVDTFKEALEYALKIVKGNA